MIQGKGNIYLVTGKHDISGW